MSSILPAPFPGSLADPSPFASAPMQPIAPKLSAPKRKRTDTSEDSTDSTAHPARKTRDGAKKKKANRACHHCQKAHLTCDDTRPCQRCIKRGISANCTEGHRKKAKYLLDEEEIEQLKRNKTSHAPAPESVEESPVPSSSEPLYHNDAAFNVSFDPNFPFGSEAANLEYSILSAILGNPSPPDTTKTPPPPPQTYAWPVNDSIQFGESPRVSTYVSTFGEPQLSIQPSATTLALSPPMGPSYLTYSYQEPQRTNEASDLLYPSQYQQPDPSAPLHPLQPRFPLDARPRSPPTSFLNDASGLLSPSSASYASPSSLSSVPAGGQKRPACSHLQSINDRITKPYDYTEGYHFLMKHLPSRFEKNDILRIVRALAIFRPSLIALQMPLSLDDEVFVEKCFQRSLLELDKLISFSGTPTVVWRRTGEICLVAPEFCMLTEWSTEELVGRKKYIYELFENQSVVEYWENFASHAFENTTQSVYSHCVLLKPSGAPVPSTFCWSIRRDLFDLPSVVIGQWLPLL